MIPRFVFPQAFWLLPIVIWAVWVGIKLRSMQPIRKWMAIAIRVVILLLLIAALAGMEMVKTEDKLAVFFLLDRSDSIPESKKTEALQQMRNYCDAYLTDKDEAGVIVFGQGSSIELSVNPRPELDAIKSFVESDQTNLASAIRLALAAFPHGVMKRIVVLTDGNETMGVASEEVKIAQSSGVEVDFVPLRIGGTPEVRIKELNAPVKVNVDEPHKISITVHADQDCEAKLRLYVRTKEGRKALPAQDVILKKGDNTFLLSQEIKEPGFFEYEAAIEADLDTIVANNEGRSFSSVKGEPLVLIVDANPGAPAYLAKALVNEGLQVQQIAPVGLPDNLAQFQNYDVIVLSNVSATDLTTEQMKNIEAAVRDMGIGLVMIGGPDSFGAGGFLDSPIERALPVDMTIKHRKILPKGALVVILHTCEIQDGNMWAREIALAALQVLASKDQMGAVGYLYNGGDQWLFHLQPTGDKSMMRSVIYQASTRIGDMPDMAPSLSMACKALSECDASVKRVVLISDGDPASPTSGLLKKMSEARISVSTVCISPHQISDQQSLRRIALATGGNYYFVTNPNNLPQIFTKEAAQVKRGQFIEETFTPQFYHNSELLTGFQAESFPTLDGYVVASPKDEATIALVGTEDDPLLAHWRYGLGKSVAFTSDVTTRWASDWVAWQGFGRFWAQTIRWAMRPRETSDFQVETWIDNGKGYVRIDAVDDEGKFVNFLDPVGTVSGPAPNHERYDLKLVQKAPGIYEDSFPLNDTGVYMLNLSYISANGIQGNVQTGLALEYSREYEFNSSNLLLLNELAALGGGRIFGPETNPFEHNLKLSPSVKPIWPYLLMIAVCLFPLEIFIRRVMIDLMPVVNFFLRLLCLVPALGKWIPMPKLRPGPVTGQYLSAESKERSFDSVQPEEQKSFGVEIRKVDTETTAAGKAEEHKKPEEGQTEYTQQLLAAKKRALEKRKGPKKQ